MTSHRPYLLRALYEWISDNGMTPHLLVDATRPGVRVPAHTVNDGKVVLNIAARAVAHLSMDNDAVAFTARFAGVSHAVIVPVSAVLAIYAREIGQGMGPALNTAAGMNAYVLADRGTWLSFKNRADLVIAVEGDRRLFNQYGIILVKGSAKRDMGQAFIDWVVSREGQDAIAAYKIGGQQLFFPNAGN